MLLIQSSEQGLPLDNYTKVCFWYEYLLQDQVFKKMIDLFLAAYEAG